jgi:hypothetical protein
LKSTLFFFGLSGEGRNPGFAPFQPPLALDAGLRRHDGASTHLLRFRQSFNGKIRSFLI